MRGARRGKGRERRLVELAVGWSAEVDAGGVGDDVVGVDCSMMAVGASKSKQAGEGIGIALLAAWDETPQLIFDTRR